MSYLKLAVTGFLLDVPVKYWRQEVVSEMVIASLIQDIREVELLAQFQQLSFVEIEKIVKDYVLTVRVRPLLSLGGIGTLPKYHFSFPKKPKRVFWIFLCDELDQEERIQTFTHEVLHIFFCRGLVFWPDESTLDDLARFLAERFRKEISVLLKSLLDLPQQGEFVF